MYNAFIGYAWWRAHDSNLDFFFLSMGIYLIKIMASQPEAGYGSFFPQAQLDTWFISGGTNLYVSCTLFLQSRPLMLVRHCSYLL